MRGRRGVCQFFGLLLFICLFSYRAIRIFRAEPISLLFNYDLDHSSAIVCCLHFCLHFYFDIRKSKAEEKIVCAFTYLSVFDLYSFCFCKLFIDILSLFWQTNWCFYLFYGFYCNLCSFLTQDDTTGMAIIALRFPRINNIVGDIERRLIN